MGLNRVIMLAAAALLFAAVMLPEAAAVRYTVGGKVGWSQSGVNYTIWAQDIKFNTDDWLCMLSFLLHSDLLFSLRFSLFFLLEIEFSLFFSGYGLTLLKYL